MDKRILITGATGFIGRNVLAPLVEKGFDVHALYIKEPLQVPSVSWHSADLFDGNAAERALHEIRPSHLLHLAWHVHPKDYKTSPENDRWHLATVRILQAFAGCGGKRAVLAGTAMEYEPTLASEFIDESAPTAKHNAYASAKIRTHEEAASIAKEHGISLVWGRIFNLYGPNEARGRLMPELINALMENKRPNIPTGGMTLDYSYVKDTAKAFAMLSDDAIEGAVNVASGRPLTLKQIATEIGRLMGKPELVSDINDKTPDSGPSRVVADITRLRNEVGFTPDYDLARGLAETVAWWQARN